MASATADLEWLAATFVPTLGRTGRLESCFAGFATAQPYVVAFEVAAIAVAGAAALEPVEQYPAGHSQPAVVVAAAVAFDAFLNYQAPVAILP